MAIKRHAEAMELQVYEWAAPDRSYGSECVVCGAEFHCSRNIISLLDSELVEQEGKCVYLRRRYIPDGIVANICFPCLLEGPEKAIEKLKDTAADFRDRARRVEGLADALHTVTDWHETAAHLQEEPEQIEPDEIPF